MFYSQKETASLSSFLILLTLKIIRFFAENLIIKRKKDNFKNHIIQFDTHSTVNLPLLAIQRKIQVLFRKTHQFFQKKFKFCTS